MNITSVHSLEDFKSFTGNHTKHTFTIKSEGLPCDGRAIEMEVEISREEVDLFINLIETKMWKDIEEVD